MGLLGIFSRGGCRFVGRIFLFRAGNIFRKKKFEKFSEKFSSAKKIRKKFTADSNLKNVMKKIVRGRFIWKLFC